MDVKAKTKFVKISPSKARDLARRIVGLPVGDALKVTDFSERKAAFLIGKTLKSAISNAGKNAGLSVDNLRVKKAVIDEGPRLKRFTPRARGSAGPILKRTCHISVVLTDEKSEG